MRKSWIPAWIVGSVLILCLIGCDTAKTAGAGRKEYPDYEPPIVFTNTEKATLLPFKTANPEVFAKVEEVHRQWSGFVAERRKQLKIAVETNRKQLTEIGRYTEAEAAATIRAHLQLHGYPADDPIYSAVK